jgi:lipopolysaccharide export system protein LptA
LLLSFALSGSLLVQSQALIPSGLSVQNPPAPPAPPTPPVPPANPTPPADPSPPSSNPDPSQPFYGESSPRVTVVRDDKTITAIKYGPDDKGLAIICPPKDDDPDQLTQTVYYDVSPWSVHITIDKNLIKTQIAFVEAKDGGDGRIEAYNGVATESSDPDRCLPDLKPDPKPGTVRVEQGKTRLTGSRLDYDRSTGIAVVEGPIVFERPQERENDTLKGNSDSIQIFVDDEKTVLEGNVTLSSKCRTSRAERVEYDDTKNRAILFGKPAVSRQNDGKGQIQGTELEYDLETNDVIVVAPYGGVSGSFDDTAEPCR